MKQTSRTAGKSARTTRAPAAELDAALAVLEQRAAGLRRAGVTRVVFGEVDLYLAPPEPAAAPVQPRAAADDGDGSLYDLAAFRAALDERGDQ